MDRAELIETLEALRRRADDHRLTVTAAALALEGTPLPGPIGELLNAFVLQANTLDLVAVVLTTQALAQHDETATLRDRVEALELEVFDDDVRSPDDL